MDNKPGTVLHPFLYEASDTQLQEFLLLGLFVAGKHAVTQQHKLNWLLEITGELYLLLYLQENAQMQILQILVY